MEDFLAVDTFQPNDAAGREYGAAFGIDHHAAQDSWSTPVATAAQKEGQAAGFQDHVVFGNEDVGATRATNTQVHAAGKAGVDRIAHQGEIRVPSGDGSDLLARGTAVIHDDHFGGARRLRRDGGERLGQIPRPVVAQYYHGDR